MQNSLDNLYAVILAAGGSTRFGSPKQLLEWQASNLIQHAFNLAQSIFNNRIIIVLGANADQIKQNLDEQAATIVLNTNWQKGMSTSIRAGVEALPENAEAAMILLCDQPLLDQVSLMKLIILWQQKPDSIIASRYQNTTGVPAIFPTSVFSQLSSLDGDNGAKQILTNMKNQVETIPLPNAGMDIDTQEDFKNLTIQQQNI